MRKASVILAAFVFTVMLGAGVVSAQSSTFQGYITLGRNVVALPYRLTLGDRVLITDMMGNRVYEGIVQSGTLNFRYLPIATGLYNVTIVRNNTILQSMTLPVKGL